MTGIVDAHHHIWRKADLPWLVGPMQPRIFGPYEAIRRAYPIREYLDDLADNGVVKSVYVQTNWAKERFEDETAWVQRTSEEIGWPHAIVAYADFGADDVRPQLDRLHLRHRRRCRRASGGDGSSASPATSRRSGFYIGDKKAFGLLL